MRAWFIAIPHQAVNHYFLLLSRIIKNVSFPNQDGGLLVIRDAVHPMQAPDAAHGWEPEPIFHLLFLIFHLRGKDQFQIFSFGRNAQLFPHWLMKCG